MFSGEAGRSWHCAGGEVVRSKSRTAYLSLRPTSVLSVSHQFWVEEEDHPGVSLTTNMKLHTRCLLMPIEFTASGFAGLPGWR